MKRINEHLNNAVYIPSFEGIVDSLIRDSSAGDLVLTMGAGDVDKVGELFLAEKNQGSELGQTTLTGEVLFITQLFSIFSPPGQSCRHQYSRYCACALYKVIAISCGFSVLFEPVTTIQDFPVHTSFSFHKPRRSSDKKFSVG